MQAALDIRDLVWRKHCLDIAEEQQFVGLVGPNEGMKQRKDLGMFRPQPRISRGPGLVFMVNEVGGKVGDSAGVCQFPIDPTQ